MAFFMKTMISNQVKNLGFGGGSEEKKEEGGASDPAAAQGMTREEYEEYQKQMIEEKMERDAAFTHKKAERACLRVHLREKYRLPKCFQSVAACVQLKPQEMKLDKGGLLYIYIICLSIHVYEYINKAYAYLSSSQRRHFGGKSKELGVHKDWIPVVQPL
ncbi:complexin-4 isoform X2 [Phyllostomus discolor]|uniref:Complexin-4 isoform X2 n=1 Tax=Phyllostomus discolor TaxID=89673 RepID=A0A7E6CGA7_9CHIR|nr:complexin-4 isoform X2 [Phyllostomus discolor]